MATFGFKTSSIAIPFLAEYADSLPILVNCNKQLDAEYKAGTGTTMTMILPDHPDVTTGAAIDEAQLGYTGGTQSLTLTQRKVALGADQVQRALSIKDFKGQVAKPYGAKLASEIQKLAAKEVQMSASHQVVIAAATAFEDLGALIASIRASRSFDELAGCVGPALNSRIISSGIKFFNPSTQISEMFKNSRLGVYNTAEFYSSPDVVGLTTGTLALGAGTQLNVKNAVTVAGTTTLTLQVTGGTATMTGTIVAGQSVIVDGCDAVDIYGVDVGTPYAFVSQTTATAAANEIELTVLPLYTSAHSKPLANVSAYPAADAAASLLQASNSVYLGGIVWDKQALLFGSAQLAPIAGTESENFADGPNGLSIRVTRGPDIMQGREVVRYDVLNGFKLVRQNWAGAVWFKVA